MRKERSAEFDENSRNPNFCITAIVVSTIRILLLHSSIPVSLPLTRAGATRYDCRFSRILCATRRRHYPGKKKGKKEITIFGEFGSMFAFHAVFFQAAYCRGGGVVQPHAIIVQTTRYSVATRYFDCYLIISLRKQTNKQTIE